MKTLIEIKRKIKTAEEILKVTKATAAISRIRFQNASVAVKNAIKYQHTFETTIQKLRSHLNEPDKRRIENFFTPKDISNTIAVVLSSDRGLCGTYNKKLMDTVKKFSRDQIRSGKKISFLSYGKHARSFLLKSDRTILASRPAVSFESASKTAAALARMFREKYLSAKAGEIFILSNRLVGGGYLQPVAFKLLPLTYVPEQEGATQVDADEDEGILDKPLKQIGCAADFEFDLQSSEFLKKFISNYIDVTIYRAVLESILTEHAARMNAMRQSSSSAEDLIEDLVQQHNKMRQAKITDELVEIISGAEALN